MTACVVIRGLLKFAAVVVVAGAVGAGVGIGLAKLSGEGEVDAARIPAEMQSTQTTSPATPSTTAASLTSASAAPTSTTPAAPGRVPRVDVESAELFAASTPSGRGRQRARLVVLVSVTNRLIEPLEASRPQLIVGGSSIASDPQASELAGPLLRAIAPGASADGELRFETAGAITQRLTTQPRARLSIAGRTVALNIQISDTPLPIG